MKNAPGNDEVTGGVAAASRSGDNDGTPIKRCCAARRRYDPLTTMATTSPCPHPTCPLPPGVRRLLVAEIRDRAERHEPDVVLQALAVSCGAHAIGVPSPCDDAPDDDGDPPAASSPTSAAILPRRETASGDRAREDLTGEGDIKSTGHGEIHG